MIVVDTSALMAIVLDERQANDCIDALSREGELLISAVTVAEASIVATRRGLGEEMERLIGSLGFEIVAVTAASASARRIAEAYEHPAALGDCFAYELAKERNCPLLYAGDDFCRTDVESVL